VTAFPATIGEARTFKLGGKFPYLLWHEITAGYFAALVISLANA
jgi:hypothetical protein